MIEKSQLLDVGGALPLDERVRTRRRPLPSYIIGLLTVVALIHLCRNGTSLAANKDDIVLGKLLPTKCWDSFKFEAPFKCYHMYAPLDYLNETDERTARLAVAMYPAGAGKTKKKDILGTLLLNPGEGDQILCFKLTFVIITSCMSFSFHSAIRWSWRERSRVHLACRLTWPIQD